VGKGTWEGPGVSLWPRFIGCRAIGVSLLAKKSLRERESVHGPRRDAHRPTLDARRLSSVWHIAFLFCVTFSHSAPEIDITAQVDRAEVTVGDPIRYEITVTGPAGARVDLPAVRGNTGKLEVLAYTVRTDTATGGRAAVTHALTLAAYATGTDTLPSQRVEIRIPPDTAAAVFYTPLTFITVAPTAPADAKDIADIHDGERLPRGFPWGLPLLLALIAAGVWLYRRWKRRRALKPVPVIPPRLVPADEAALAQLLELERTVTSLAHPEREREAAHAFAFAFSGILREYMAARFGIDALEATTAELLERVAPLPLDAEQHAWIRTISEELDTVKFATGTLSPADAARLIAGARALVHATPEPAVQGGDAVPVPDTGTTP
jgi:hypothetical protein